MLLPIALCILVSCTKTTTSYPTLTRRPRSYIFDFTGNPQKRSSNSAAAAAAESLDGEQLLAQYLGQEFVRRARSGGNGGGVLPPPRATPRRSRQLKTLFSYLVNSMGRDPGIDGHIEAPSLPLPERSAAPADSHVLRTRASPSSSVGTTGVMDFGGGEVEEEGKGEIVCKFAPYRKCYWMGEDGKLRPMRRRAQPVNTMRVYKRGG